MKSPTIYKWSKVVIVLCSNKKIGFYYTGQALSHLPPYTPVSPTRKQRERERWFTGQWNWTINSEGNYISMWIWDEKEAQDLFSYTDIPWKVS